jgi:hypothetical protein
MDVEVMKMRMLDMKLNKSAILTPSEYLKLYSECPECIKRARMIPPRIGKDKHFGKMQVVFAFGRYEAR